MASCPADPKLTCTTTAAEISALAGSLDTIVRFSNDGAGVAAATRSRAVDILSPWPPQLEEDVTCKQFYKDELKTSWSPMQLQQFTGMWCAVVALPGSTAAAAGGFEHFLSREHGAAWAWITERRPDGGGVTPRPLPGSESYQYACSLFYGTNGRYLTVVNEEERFQRPHYRQYKQPS